MLGDIFFFFFIMDALRDVEKRFISSRCWVEYLIDVNDEFFMILFD